jgi:hypothetical protein
MGRLNLSTAVDRSSAKTANKRTRHSTDDFKC